MDQFLTDLRQFFNLHLHSNNSDLVQNEFLKLWTLHRSKGVIKLDQNWTLSSQQQGQSPIVLSSIKLIKYLSRRHGLPPSICTALQASLDSSAYPISTKFQIATTLKNGLLFNENGLDIGSIFKSLSIIRQTFQETSDQELDQSMLYAGTISQLMQCITIKLNPDNCDPQIISQIDLYRPHVDLKTKSMLQTKLVKIGVTLGDIQEGGGAGDSKILNIKKMDLLDDTFRDDEKNIFNNGSTILGHVHSKLKQKTGLTGQPFRADAVKSQQAVTTVFKQNVSEKTDIESINLAHALNSGRGRSRGAQQNLEVAPAVSNDGDSVRSYFRTTAMEVNFLHTRAISGATICDDDISYLRDKFVGFKFSLIQFPSTISTTVTTIFSIISKNHVIAPGVLDSLAAYAFKDVLDSSWDNRRHLLLKTFQQCGEQNQKGKLPTKTEEILTKFKSQTDCDPEMKKIIWRIFKKNDDNLQKTFADSIEAIYSTSGTPSDEHLEYIAEQVNIEQRAIELENVQKFVPKLLTILHDSDNRYTTHILTQVAQIVCDYLDHESSPGLSVEWLQKFMDTCHSITNSKEGAADAATKWTKNVVEANQFQSYLVQSILKSLNKDAFDCSNLPPTLLTFLVRNCCRKKNRKLEALIVTTLGNIVIKFPTVIIPHAELLAFWLTRTDFVDQDGRIHLQTDEDHTSLGQDGSTLVSNEAGHVLLHYLKSMIRSSENFKCRDLTLNYLVEALSSSPDKNTRILCSESLFALVIASQSLSQTMLGSIRPHAEELEMVPDVKIHCRAAYCTAIAKKSSLNATPMSSHDLTALGQMYAFEKLVLDEKDYTTHVNPPILRILSIQAPITPFPDLVFQLLTFNLRVGEFDSNMAQLTLQIILDQIQSGKMHHNYLPHYCKEAVENTFLCEPTVRPESCQILLSLCMKMGQFLSDAVIDEVYKNLNMDDDLLERDHKLLILLFTNFGQDLADHIFQNLDLELAGVRLLLHLGCEREKFVGIGREIFEEFVKISKNSRLSFESNMMDTISTNLTHGLRASPMILGVLAACLKLKPFSEKSFQCLTYAAENGQTLSAELIEIIFEVGRRTNSKVLPTIALAIVQNNQTLPLSYLQVISLEFCGHDFSTIFGSTETHQQILAILTKLVQNNHKFPQLPLVCQKFCEGFAPQNGGSHRQRLELLSALSSIVNCGEELREDLNKDNLKQIFIAALHEDNGQILETGLHGFIALNTTANNYGGQADFCNDSDFKLLLQIQRRPSVSSSVRNSIADFFSSQKKRLPRGLQASLNLSNLEHKSDTEFLTDLPMLLKLQDHQFFQSSLCQQRLQNLLVTTHDPSNLSKALEIIHNYPFKGQLPLPTFEAVTFALVNNPKVDDCRQLSHKILDVSLDDGVKFSQMIVQYLQIDLEFNGQLILKIQKTLKIIDPLLLDTLEFQRLLENKKLDGKGLKQFDQLFTQLQLDERHFHHIMTLNLSPLKSSLNFINFLGRSILKFSHPPGPHGIQTAGKILESGLLDQPSKIELQVFQAYTQLVDRGEFVGNLKNVVKSLTAVYTNKKCMLERKLAILKTFAAIFKYKIGTKPIVPYATVDVLLNELKNVTPGSSGILRKFCLQALNNLRAGNLKPAKKKEGGHQDIGTFQIEFVDHLHNLVYDVYAQIFGDDMRVVQNELAKDPQFAGKFLEFLYSLNYWDLKSLRGVQQDRSRWHEILVNSDFLATHAQSLDEQLEFQLQLNDIRRHYFENDEKYFTPFLQLISLRCGQIRHSLIPVLLNSLSKLSPNDAILILEDSEFEKNWQNSTQQIVIAELLRDKFEFKISPAILQICNQRLVNLVGIELAVTVCNAISKIDSILSLEELIGIFETKIWRESSSILLLQNVKTKLKISAQSCQQVKVILECQILLSLLPAGVTRKLRLERILSALLTDGFLLEDLQQLITMTMTKDTKDRQKRIMHKAFEHTIFQASQYKISPLLFGTIVGHLRSLGSSKLKDFVPLVNKMIGDGIFDGKYGAKDIEQIVKEFRLNNSRTSYKWSCLKERFLKAGYQFDFLKLKIIQIQNGDDYSQIYAPVLFKPKIIGDWDRATIRAWASEVITGGYKVKELSANEFYLEALMVAKQAMKLHRNFHLTFVQILSCLLALQKLEKDKDKGQLQQVATGSGKSAIIAILSVIKSLEGHTVDVYTSSPVLAERDAKEWKKFYDLFGVQCDHNGDKGSQYVKGEKGCYRKQIVYGECSQFQFDYLRDKYSDLKTLAGRSLDFAIVDEVDSMFIDDSSKLARLSSTLPGMDLLEILYHFMWDRLSYLKTHLYSISENFYYLEGQTSTDERSGVTCYNFAHRETNELMRISNLFAYIINDGDLETARIHPIQSIESFVRDHLQDYAKSLIGSKSSTNENPVSKIKLPVYLQEFALIQIPKWVDSALTALAYQQNVHYVVDHGQIKPVDFQTTGVVQGNTNWNNGLHQFLGFKHSLKIQPETITTNFLSNFAIFRKYGSNILGFTGTLGSAKDREVLYKVYNVKLLTLPETKFKRYRQFPAIVTASEDEWMKEIVISTLEETSKGRGVLVICETILKADLISQAIANLKIKVKVYTKNDEEGQGEKHIERIHPGDVIVATNLAGRGTDIKTLDIEAHGGLHVCLTFLPQSQRIEEQAFGRTSRQGNKGTGQLIILSSNNSNDPHKKSQVDYHRKTRDDEEKSSLDNFKDKEFPSIHKKDELFGKFCACFNRIRCQLKEEKKSWIKKKTEDTLGDFSPLAEETLGPFELTVLQSVEERWAIFLRQVDDGLIPLEESLEAYQEFESLVEKEMAGGGENLLKSASNLFYFIQLGHQAYYRGSSNELDKAKKYFDIAMVLDPSFSAGAFVGKASVLLKTNQGSAYKEDALKLYEKALPLLYDEMATITVAQSLVVRQHPKKMEDSDSPPNSKLFYQLTEKSNLLGTFINTIRSNMNAIERSLRRVHCTKIRGVTKKTKGKSDDGRTRREISLIPNDLIKNDRSLSNWDGFDEYWLTFHDLTVSADMGTVDQALQTLNLKGENAVTSRVPVDVTKWWKSIDFKVNLNCPCADLSKLVQEDGQLELWTKENVTVSMEFFGLELNQEKNQLLFPIHEMTLGVRSLDLEIVGSSKHLEKISLDPEFNGLGMAVEFKTTKDAAGDKAQDCNVEILSSKAVRRMEQMATSKDKLTSLNCIGLGRGKDIGEILKILQKFNFPLTFNLTLDGLEKNKKLILESWDKFLSNYGQNKLVLGGMSDGVGQKIIPILRKLNMPFTMEITRLTFKSAQVMLENASLKQEEMKQCRIQELIELYMKDSMPLLEIQQLAARGISILVSFSEELFVPWISIASLCTLAALQITAGGFLIATGFGASMGMGMITEGMSDFVYARTAYTSRQLDWASYGKQKAVSLTITCVSLGLSSLKDGAKGAIMVGKAVTDKATETAATAVFTTTIEASGQNLTSLAVKQIGVSAMETGGRIGLKALTENLSNFCFEQLRETIAAEVASRVTANFDDPNLKRVMSKHAAIENLKKVPGISPLKSKIDSIVTATTNPKATFWDTVATPLCNGIFSDPRFGGSQFATAVLCWGAIKGVKEIWSAITKVCTEIRTKLDQEQINFAALLQSHCGMTKEVAKEVASKLKFKPSSESKCDFDLINLSDIAKDSEDDKRVLEFLKTLKSHQKSFDSSSSQMSTIRKSVVDLITGHIIKVANSHLVSPVMSKLGGQLVGKISAELQSAFLVNRDQDGLDQKRITEIKAKDKTKLTDEDKEFLKKYDKPITISSQIYANAKDYMVAYQTREQVILTDQLILTASQEGGDESTVPREVTQKAASALKGDPADIVLMMAAARREGKLIKIVTDENYKPTQEEIDKGYRIVVYDPPGVGQTVGHFRLKTEDGTKFVQIESSGNNCGYDIVGHLADKKGDEIRLETSRMVLENAGTFEKIMVNQKWMQDRYPEEASKFLFVGGLERPVRKASLRYRQEHPEEFPEPDPEPPRVRRRSQRGYPKPEDVDDILDRGPKPSDNEGGWVYTYTDKGPLEEGEGRIKVGKTTKEDPVDRMKETAKRNERKTGVKQDYVFGHAVWSPFPLLAEDVSQAILGNYRAPVGDTNIEGRTERFNVSIEEARSAMYDGKRLVDERVTKTGEYHNFPRQEE